MTEDMKIKAATSQNQKTKRRGFTLTEIAIVLGIIGLILGAIWAAASSVYANQKANSAQQGILAAAQAVRSMFATSANTGVTGANIASPGMFPINWQSPTGSLGNPWHINPAANKNFAFVFGNQSVFGIELDGISNIGCAQLVAFYNQASSSVNGGSVPGLVGNNISINAPGGTPANAPVLLAGAWPTALAPSFLGSSAGCTNAAADLDYGLVIYFDMSIM